MKFIKILNWSQITMDNIDFFPVLFFFPDINVIEFIKEYGYDASIQIRNTQSYDGIFIGKFQISNLDTLSTNDFNTLKPVYSIIINTPFTIYPCQKGEFLIMEPKLIHETINPLYNDPELKEQFEDIDLNEDISNKNNLDIESLSSSPSNSILETINKQETPIQSIYNLQKLKILLYVMFFLFLFIFIYLFFFSH